MKFLLAALLAAAFIFLYGCVQVEPPQNCAALPAAEQPGCVYYSAVSAQNPYVCYAIQDKADRETCLKDAIDPAAAKKLARSAKPPTTAKIKAPSLPSPSAQNATEQPAQNTTKQEENVTAVPPVPEANATNQSS